MNKKINIGTQIATLGIFIIMLIVASIMDLNISKAMYLGESAGILGAVLGKVPAWIMCLIATSVLLRNAWLLENKNKKRIPLILLYVLGVIASGFLMGYSMADDILTDINKYISALLIGLGAAIFAVYFIFKVKEENILKLRKWAITSLIAVAVVVIAVAGLKLVWGRTRYIDYLNGIGQYSDWFEPQGIKGGDSFPSGHTGLAACIFLIIPLFKSIGKDKNYLILAYCLSLAFVLFIMFSRIMGGHHFMSDVVIAAIIGFVTVSIATDIAYGTDMNKIEFSEKSIWSVFY